ncbi:hypothetical protein C8Q74DRAFT_867989 [Fomes fomentarius]|nr:hypothetical protein C8Q74DRAFT_867989 [Fomes fomentarius]
MHAHVHPHAIISNRARVDLDHPATVLSLFSTPRDARCSGTGAHLMHHDHHLLIADKGSLLWPLASCHPRLAGQPRPASGTMEPRCGLKKAVWQSVLVCACSTLVANLGRGPQCAIADYQPRVERSYWSTERGHCTAADPDWSTCKLKYCFALSPGPGCYAMYASYAAAAAIHSTGPHRIATQYSVLVVRIRRPRESLSPTNP